jgi:hypothetical protein
MVSDTGSENNKENYKIIKTKGPQWDFFMSKDLMVHVAQ